MTNYKEVFGAKGAEGLVVAMTPLQRVLTPALSRKKWKISPKSSTITITRKDITPPSVSKGQKANVGLSDFYAGDWN